MGKIYRLAEKFDQPGTKVMVIVKTFPDQGLKIMYGSLKYWSKGRGFGILFDNGSETICDFPFVEVTLADFATEQLTAEMIARGITFFGAKNNLGKYHYWSLDEPPKEKTLADFSEDDLIAELQKRKDELKKELVKNILNLCQVPKDSIGIRKISAIEAIEGADLKENLYNSYNSGRALGYEQGYEAGKRDAGPKWVSVKQSMPSHNENVWVFNTHHGFIDTPVLHQVWFEAHGMSTCGWQNGYDKFITHWMPLRIPKPPEQEIAPEPKSKCAQCGKEAGYNFTHNNTLCFCDIECANKYWGQKKCSNCKNNLGAASSLYQVEKNGSHKIFCSKQCAEDSQWVDAEFPRDAGKECKFKSDYTAGYQYGIISGIECGYIRVRWVGGSALAKDCQVRKDSVEE